jgi:tRNA pseudouridine55 synthase
LEVLISKFRKDEAIIQNPKSKIQNVMVGGVLIIDKPAGLTSHDVVARVRRIIGERRVGHTGTLDPFATGVLVVLIGRATRLAQFLSGADKEYLALIRFGYATETGDLTGARLDQTVNADQPTAPELPLMNWTEPEIEAALAHLRGEIEQVPPMYSAKKIRGQKLYELARAGLEVERAPVRVRVRELETVNREGGALLHKNEDGTIDLRVRVVCSAGTYVRALAESIGERLGVGAHLAALRRTRAGSFSLEEAITLEDLAERADALALDKVLVSLTAALSGMPSMHLTSEEAARARHGMAVRARSSSNDAAHPATYTDEEPVFMIDEDGGLIAVAIYEAETGVLRPRVVLAPEK